MDHSNIGDDGALFQTTQDDSLVPQDCEGEAEIVPRIGDVFQVQLPAFIGDSNYRSETAFHEYQSFLVGMPIPIILKDQKLGDRSSTQSGSCLYENGPLIASTNFAEAKNVSDEDKIAKCSHATTLVPGNSDVQWSASEKEGFLLALYIFEKDFVEVKRFLETKETGALLSYYYGKFYGSQEYRRWSDCRKVKGKKGFYGRRLLSGLRQQELLSRILPRVSEECQNSLAEVSKGFADDKMSLAEYVSSLKKTVGLGILVDAVGIGTGKRDLTTMALESSRSNQGTSSRPEIPVGKACSALTASEIIRFLSGDYRLSKARSNDLFWEAVWPRLLARGWHSEQPKDSYSTGSKNPLVFLVPDVKKFSRRKLVKGGHYFDSVTDVLSQVAQEPGLIRLENEEEGGCVKKEEYDAWSDERKMEVDDIDQPARQKPCFLQPKTPKRSTSATKKFTVVDTMSVGKIRELRALPFETSVPSTALVFYEDTDEVSSESDTASPVDQKRASSAKKTLPVKKDGSAKSSVQDSGSAAAVAPGSKKRNDICKKVSKSQKRKHDDVSVPATATKKCRALSTSKQEETNAVLPRTGIGSTMLCCHESENSCSRVGLCVDKLSSAGSCRSSPMESLENSHPQTLIDLNLPQTSPDSENRVSTRETETDESRTEQQIATNPGRHSRRNQTLTSKAMEALVNGYLTVNRKRKADTSLAPRRPQRARVRTVPDKESLSSFAAGSQVEEAENGASYSGIANGVAQLQAPKLEKTESVSEHFHANNGAASGEDRSF